MSFPWIADVPKYFLCLITLFTYSAGRGYKSESTPPNRFPFAYVQPDCGPADGPALVFHFTVKESQNEKYEEPFISLSIIENLPNSAPRDYAIKPGGSGALAALCRASGQCVRATSGTLHLTKFAQGKVASGEYELHFQDGSVERAAFDATWRRMKLMCG
jgi:hypothetical protein